MKEYQVTVLVSPAEVLRYKARKATPSPKDTTVANAAATITCDTSVGTHGLLVYTSLMPTIVLAVIMVFSSKKNRAFFILFLQLLLGFLEPLDLCFRVQNPNPEILLPYL